MSIKESVDKDWWKNIFDEIYLLTDSRSIGDHELTCREVDYIESVMELGKTDSLLDLCSGQGRHSLELARRGYSRITALDYSGCLIEMGEKDAANENLNIRFIRGDARDTGLPGNQFDKIMIMASSFGYFVDDRENLRILKEVCRLLKGSGLLLLDLPDRSYVISHFRPFSEHHINENIMVTRERKLENDIMYCRETVNSKKGEMMRRSTYCIKLYTSDRITCLLNDAGFHRVCCKIGFMDRAGEGDYGCLTNRMVVTATKRSHPANPSG